MLLLRGPRERVRALSDGRTLALLGNVEYQPARHARAAIAVVIFDFLRLGTPLTVLVLGLLTIAIPWRWPF